MACHDAVPNEIIRRAPAYIGVKRRPATWW